MGCPVSLYLTAAGVGSITIVDHDTVDLSNLQRQVLFRANDVGKNKAASAIAHLKALNSDIQLSAVDEALSASNANSLINDADLVLDCTDNFATRYLINDTCWALGKTWIYASIWQFSGQCAIFNANTACFRCVFPKPPSSTENCNENGVLGVLPGMLGTIQASEAIKYLCQLPTALEGKLLLYDALKLESQKIGFQTDAKCICCSEHQVLAQVLAQDYADLNDSHKLVKTRELTVERFLEQKKDKNVTVVDVRSTDERDQIHYEGMHIPLDELEARAFELQKDHAIICYCESGKRSLKAVGTLSELGFNAKSIKGGLNKLLNTK